MPDHVTIETRARWACIYAGVIYGIYWIPLRVLDAAGFSGPWAAFLMSAVPLVLILPLLWFRRSYLRSRGWRFHIGSILLGLALVLYSTAFLYTEVMRAAPLFYLLPLWGFLLGRIFSGDPITIVRWLSIAIGMAGMTIVLGLDGSFPLPRNVGDWFALCSGMIWALGSLMLLVDPDSDPVSYTGAFYFWSALIAFGMAVIATRTGVSTYPPIEALGGVLVWFVPFALIFLVTSSFASIFSVTLLNPGVVGLLFMIEVVVATISAALFAGEPFGIQQIVGVCMVTLAGALEPLSGRLERAPGTLRYRRRRAE